MNLKRLSVRFDLNVDLERQAWEHLHTSGISMNQTIISAINDLFEPVSPAVKDALRDVMQECLHDVSILKSPQPEQAQTISDDETALLDSLDDLLGG